MQGLWEGAGAEIHQTKPKEKEKEQATVVPERNPVALTKGANTGPGSREPGMMSLGELHSGFQAEGGLLVSSFPTRALL